ncbi:Pyruvate:ferredoxin oxidoreductase, gamma subunit, partial [Candidatus Kryptobacter tengchongensis]
QWWGKLIDKFGAKNVLMFNASNIAYIPILWLLATPDFLLPLYIDAIMVGIAWSGFNLAEFNIPLSKAPKENRSTYVAVLSISSGFGYLFASMLAGYIATLLKDIFKLQVQAYPKYGSEKKGLPTTYYLTASREKIRTHCELTHVEFVPMNDVNAFNLGNPLAGLRENGMIFIQSDKVDPKDVWSEIPSYAKKIIKDKKIKVYYLDTVKIAREVAPTPDLEQRMQGIVLLGIFLKVTPFREEYGLSEEDLFKGVEKSIRKYFGKRGEKVVQANLEAVKRGYYEVMEVPRELIEVTEVKAEFEI